MTFKNRVGPTWHPPIWPPRTRASLRLSTSARQALAPLPFPLLGLPSLHLSHPPIFPCVQSVDSELTPCHALCPCLPQGLQTHISKGRSRILKCLKKISKSVNPIGGAQTLQLPAHTPVPSDPAVSHFLPRTLLFSGHASRPVTCAPCFMYIISFFPPAILKVLLNTPVLTVSSLAPTKAQQFVHMFNDLQGLARTWTRARGHG